MMNESEIMQAGRDAERFIVAMNDYLEAVEKKSGIRRVPAKAAR